MASGCQVTVNKQWHVGDKSKQYNELDQRLHTLIKILCVALRIGIFLKDRM